MSPTWSTIFPGVTTMCASSGFLMWYQDLLMWYRDVLMWYKDLLMWYKDLLVWYQDLLMWYQDLLMWYQDLLMWYKDLLVWYKDLLMWYKALLVWYKDLLMCEANICESKWRVKILLLQEPPSVTKVPWQVVKWFQGFYYQVSCVILCYHRFWVNAIIGNVDESVVVM